jgi:PPOX class probable F420-dependent enzyme
MAKSSKRHAVIPQSHVDILQSCCYPVVSTLRPDGMLSSNPVSMVWDDDNIRFSTLKDRMKYRNLLADPRISLCIAHPDNPLHYIEVRGYAELEDDTTRSFVNQIAKKYMGVDEYPFDPPGAPRVTVTVRVEQISTPLMGKVGNNQ